MSDFYSTGWSIWISAVSVLGIIFCLWLLYTQRGWLKKDVQDTEFTGHVWDGDITELNTSVPRWWTIMYVALCIFGFGYLVLYPGLGSFQGVLGFSSAAQVRADQIALQKRIEPVYERFREMPVAAIAADEEGRQIGQRLFLNNCAQCHGEDLRGTDHGPSFLSPIYEPGHHGDGAFLLAVQNGVRAHHWQFGDMPPVEGLSADDVEAIVAYVRETQRTEGFEP